MNIDLSVADRQETVVGVIAEGDLRVHIINYSNKTLVNSFAIHSDTKHRMCFSIALNCVIIGSWRKDLTCYSLATGERIWSASIKSFTNIFILEESKLLIISGRTDGDLVLKIADGRVCKKLDEAGFRVSQKYVLGNLNLSTETSTIQLYDQKMSPLSSSAWRSWAIDCFDVDPYDNVVVAGPTEICRFKVGEDGRATKCPIDFERFLDITWNNRNKRFFGIAYFKDMPSDCHSLISFDSTLARYEIIKELTDSWKCMFVNKGRHLICDSGLLFDIDEKTELDPIDWMSLIPH